MKPRRFDYFCAIDWSGATGPRQKGIAVALCAIDGGAPALVQRDTAWSREEVLGILRDDLPADTLVGMDLGISLPWADCGAFFPGWVDSPDNAKELWALIDHICTDDPNLEASSFVDHPELSHFFRRHGGREGDRFHTPDAPDKRGRLRVTERAQQAMGCKPYSNFNLVGAAQVGKSSLTGMRMLHKLNGALPVWPIDPLPGTGSVIVEIYTGLAAIAAGRSASRSKIRDCGELNAALAALDSPSTASHGPIDDHSSDAILTAAWLRKVAENRDLWSPKGLSSEIAATEGWTFGAF
ncbi:hypothetical protein QWY75_07210 [Pontixanthobacter aestiaquae]|uniref:DUF429 domain-containing protein n=1 Tax=Pontixanthobacter aestiaquae TaxID=1509367 RepID=A0A844Z6Y8_9SPHN|nr:hypothetical protein [Pontixanthobacter aestiaquae]MDN3645991.1 hypothetical protein [Pontixanthobacter aestiaquae]MXO83016.1 hypothetical protein [Pontixanthobacter aestiaquae]